MAAQSDTKAPDIVVRATYAASSRKSLLVSIALLLTKPVSAGGGDAGPDPYNYLLISLVSATSMTVGLYARRHQFPLENITVRSRIRAIHANGL